MINSRWKRPRRLLIALTVAVTSTAATMLVGALPAHATTASCTNGTDEVCFWQNYNEGGAEWDVLPANSTQPNLKNNYLNGSSGASWNDTISSFFADYYDQTYPQVCAFANTNYGGSEVTLGISGPWNLNFGNYTGWNDSISSFDTAYEC